VGANILSGLNAFGILKTTKQMLSQGGGLKNPFGDDQPSNLILDSLA
jgi:hypothetical protein